MGYSPGFLLKIGRFRTFRNYPKSKQTIPKVVGNPITSTKEAFQGVWNDSQHLPKSAIFKTMGRGFLLKIGRFRTFRNSPQIDTNNPDSSGKSNYKHKGGLSGSLERFAALTQIRHLQNHGL